MTQAIPANIVFIGQQSLSQQLQSVVPSHFTWHEFDSPTNKLRLLIHLRPALLIVDSHIENWGQAVTPIKSNNATRRIPIVLVRSPNITPTDGILAGADWIQTIDQLLTNLPQIIADFARVLSSDEIERLHRDCQQQLPTLAQEGIAKFNAGAFYEQHDLFEELWMQTEHPIRDLYRAILQVGVAYYQIEQGNYRGALKMLQRSVQWLVILPNQCQGVDVEQLRQDSFLIRAMLEDLDENAFDPEQVKPYIKTIRLLS